MASSLILAGTLLPALPGPPLILPGAFIYAWHKTGFQSLGAAGDETIHNER